MCNNNPILLISNYTRAIFVASFDWRRWRHFDFPRQHICLRIFSPFLRRFSSNSLLMYLPRHFLGINWHFEDFQERLQGIWRLSKCSSAGIKVEASSSSAISKWRQMAIVRQQIPVCIMFNDLCTMLKVRFYCENKEFCYYF